MKKDIKIPRPKDMVINKWYNTLIGGNIELCKITHFYLAKDWSVVCYYSGKDLFVGSLSDCKKWLCERVIIGGF